MFDHVGLKVTDLPRSRAFYEAALAPLGLSLQSSGDDWAGYGPDDAPALWLHAHSGPPLAGTHVALRAGDADAVRAFHAAALAAGGHDNGAPGPRPAYGSGYFAAFVLDPDGHNVEAVCFV